MGVLTRCKSKKFMKIKQTEVLFFGILFFGNLRGVYRNLRGGNVCAPLTHFVDLGIYGESTGTKNEQQIGQEFRK